MNKAVILQRAKEVLNIEARGIVSLIDRLDDRFVQAVELLYNCPRQSRRYGTGKIWADLPEDCCYLFEHGHTFFFLHAGDANHGDMGMIMEGDVVLAVSEQRRDRRNSNVDPDSQAYRRER